MFDQWTKNLTLSLMLALGTASACKPQTSSTLSQAHATSTPLPNVDATPATRTTERVQMDADHRPARSELSAVEWFSKINISAEEARTVDALISSVADHGGPSGRPADAARWAERNLQIVSLDSQNLTDISPILAFKNISTLYIIGNRFNQAQVDALLRGLPKLKTLALDAGLTCAANPKVACLN